MDQTSDGFHHTQDVFQWKLDAIFLSVPGVTGIADNMIIYGRTDHDHDKNLLNFLEACQKNGLTLNPDKMQFWLPEVSFFVHTWSNKGLSLDLKKIKVVKRMEIPQDVEMMRSFLRLVKYLNWFSPRLTELSDPFIGIQANRSLQDCLSSMQRGNFQKYHPSLLQPQVTYDSTDRCVKERTLSCADTEFHASNVCFQSID